VQYSCTSGHVTTLGGDTTGQAAAAADHDNDSGCGDDSASSNGSSSSSGGGGGPASELNDPGRATGPAAYTPSAHIGQYHPLKLPELPWGRNFYSRTHTHGDPHGPPNPYPRQTWKLLYNKVAPRGRRDDMPAARPPPPADGSSTRGGSAFVRGRVRSPHVVSCKQPAWL